MMIWSDEITEIDLTGEYMFAKFQQSADVVISNDLSPVNLDKGNSTAVIWAHLSASGFTGFA